MHTADCLVTEVQTPERS